MTELITKNIVNAFTGTTPVKAIYRGTNKIWESGSGPVPPEPVPVDYDGLKIYALEPSEVTLSNKGTNNPNLEYSLDGVNWSTLVNESAVSLVKGQTMCLRGDNTTIGKSASNNSYIKIIGSTKLSGNIMSVLSKTGFKNITSVGSYCFYKLFMNSYGISDASELTLPATTLNTYCYSYMFYGCTGLTQTPALPATTMKQNCYGYMFYGCTSLTQAPTLPATSLDQSCYSNMFKGCTSLTQAPALPATAMKQGCYTSMFYGCTGLTQSPILPATSLTQSCYTNLFRGCSNLKMIRTYQTVAPTTTLSQNWVNGVSETGTIQVKLNQSWVTSLTRGDSTVPEGWTIQPVF